MKLINQLLSFLRMWYSFQIIFCNNIEILPELNAGTLSNYRFLEKFEFQLSQKQGFNYCWETGSLFVSIDKESQMYFKLTEY